MEKDKTAIMFPSKSAVLKNTSHYSDGDILDETQRLIEEAELKLRSMEAGISQDGNFTRLNIHSSVNASNDFKNQRLKQALDIKMKQLERELETKWKKQVTASDLSADAVADHSGTISLADVRSTKDVQRSRVRRPCRKLPSNHAPQDVVDVVRTARDSVQGALVAARKISATLDNRTPRALHPQHSAGVSSVRTPVDNQPADSESGRICMEHGTKRKVCSCLRPDHEELKLEQNKPEEKEAGTVAGSNLVSAKSNVGIFQAKCAASIKEDIRQPPKKLQMSVMPSVSIRRSLEKQVMPVIQVPFPGSNPDTAKRENTGVRNFRHVDPEECLQSEDAFYAQRDDRNVLPKVDGVTSSSINANAENIPVGSAVVGQVDSVEDHPQLKQILEFLLKRVTSSQTDLSPKVTGRPRSGQDPLSSRNTERSDEIKSDKSNLSSGSSRHHLKEESPGMSDDTGSIAYNSLSRFLETYSKAAVESKRAKQKAIERRKEEERSMKAEEQRFKTASAENQRNEANHLLIGPFQRAILKGSLRKSSKNAAVASVSNQIIKNADMNVVPIEDSVDHTVKKTNVERGECKEMDETTPKQSKATLEDFPPSKSSPLVEEKNAEDQSGQQNEDLSQSSTNSKSNIEAVPQFHGVPAEPSSLRTESSNDEYEDDWEEENEGDKIVEESVETRDVGDGSERGDVHDEITDGVAHPLRTIMEVEENSSLSVSLIHHEPMSQPSQSGANKSGSQPTSKSITETDDAKPLPPFKTENNSQEVPLQAAVAKSCNSQQSAEVQTVSPVHQLKPEMNSEEISSNRAFLEMTEALKKMLESVVSNLTQKNAVFHDSQDRRDSKRLSVRFEGPFIRDIRDRRGIRYEPTSSGSTNDDRVSSGSEASYSRSLRGNTSRRQGSRVRFKTGSRRSSATQTEGVKRDAETQVTPDKRNGKSERQVPEDLILRPSTLSLARTPLRPSRPFCLSFDVDPTARLLEFRRNYQIPGLPGFSGGAGSALSPEPEGRGSVSPSSSCSSVLPTDGWEYPANNTLLSLSEGEVLGCHSCSCSEGEICPCDGKRRRGRNYDSKLPDQIPGDDVLAGSAPFTPNPWSTLDSTATDNLMDLSDHFSEGEVIEKLIGISNLLNNKARDEIF